MKISTMLNNCLTYEQLQSYSLNKSGKEEKAQIYMHISTCELCACAVNGFTAISFTPADVDAIHQQIDVKINATHANPLTFVQAAIITISIASIFGFYKFADSFSQKESKPKPIASILPTVISEHVAEMILPPAKDLIVLSARAETEQPVKNKEVEKLVIAVEPMEHIPAKLIVPSLNIPEVFIEPSYNADIIYIYDLKVTRYNDLYFNYKIKPFEIKGHTPSFRENKEAADYLSEKGSEQVIAADKVLKLALAFFNKGKYEKAIAEFQLLLESNPNDINSLFYSAVAYYQIGKYKLAIRNLEAVLQNPNNVFHPEAKWNLALANLKAGDRYKAKQLLNEIINEKGFYAKRAAEKLKGL